MAHNPISGVSNGHLHPRSTTAPHSPPISVTASAPLLASAVSPPNYSRGPGAPPLSQTPRPGAVSVDPTSLDALLSRWTQYVAAKMRTARSHRAQALKARKRAEQGARVVPVISSVFEPIAVDPCTVKEPQRTLDHRHPTTLGEFADLVQGVREAIVDKEKPMLPRLNTSGSSGSYFCRRYVGAGSTRTAQTVGIFKPKDEEPYGAMNPKWTKWAHRVILAPLIGGFGRSCLIPNLSYLSEAAASLLDRRLETFIVPRTEVIDISSPSFFYSWHHRQLADRKKKPKPLPPKPGSFQVFATGFEDASSVLRTHPWPGRLLVHTLDLDAHRHSQHTSFSSKVYRLLCGNRGDFEDEDEASDTMGTTPGGANGGLGLEGWCWTKELMDDFRIEMEKLVILDFLMRNTDRGLDNFMIKVCNANCPRSRSPSRRSASESTTTLKGEGTFEDGCPDYVNRPHCHVAAIDNSLAFPHHHPHGWRAYPYGWLFLPISLIGQPFSRQTRDHFLPLLSSPRWWTETTLELRQLFATDPDFNTKMFERQMALVKGQGWNVVESLKHEDEGPLELCRREKVLVWDDPMEMPDDGLTESLVNAVNTPIKTTRGADAGPVANGAGSAGPSVPYAPTAPMRLPDAGRLCPGPMHQGYQRPLPVSRGLQGMQGDFSSARGVDVMRHMETVQAQERDFSRSLGLTMALPPGHGRGSHSLGGSEADTDDGAPWGSMSEGDLNPPGGAAAANKAAWRERIKRRLGGSWRKGKARAGYAITHRRTTSSNDASQMLLDKSDPNGAGADDGYLEALSEGGGDVGARWASLDGSVSGYLKDIEGDECDSEAREGYEMETKVVVKERLEFVSDKATFMC